MYYGVHGTELRWFRSYLSNRKQFVTYQGSKSSSQDITIGVPQGSILGPLLFIIYVNDLHLATILDTIMYADDTCVICPDSKQSAMLNNELSKLFSWLCANKLAVNVDKTKCVVFHFPQRQISANDHPQFMSQ